MGVLLDVVPNHVAADPRNPWWRDVLLHGRRSRYAKYFDIDVKDARHLTQIAAALRANPSVDSVDRAKG